MTADFTLQIARARHELHNSIGQIHGFSEMWLEDVDSQAPNQLWNCLQRVRDTAGRMAALTAQSLQAAEIEAGRANLQALQKELAAFSQSILTDIRDLKRQTPEMDKVFESDLGRMEAAAARALDLTRSGIAGLLTDRKHSARPEPASNPLASLVSAAREPAAALAASDAGVVLVVDDLEENRELLSRRLSKLGYEVHTAGGGEAALEFVRRQPLDLILLDIRMPDLDGFEVLRALKADAGLARIPVVMLSSDDQIETVVKCLQMGAEDFLPKPFNATLLMARVKSSLSHKRLRDHETSLLQRVQAEQALSDKLLLNILPRPIADRLKKGERTIADSFPQVTVLFTDFVNFTHLATTISPDVLVTRLNEIFSTFDQLCEAHGLEKIKMIGDAYMAVGGLPTPATDHAKRVTEVALAMQRAAAGFSLGDGKPCRMRIGINSGPVVAGVIGTKKFAYDLWGDTVNLASRMESHAPSGGILVTASTHDLLKSEYCFRPGKLLRVKGKGQVLTYVLLDRKTGL